MEVIVPRCAESVTKLPFPCNSARTFAYFHLCSPSCANGERGMSRLSGVRLVAGCMGLLVAMMWAGAACAQGGDLQVRRISPSGDDVQPGQEAVIQFDRAMVPLGHMGRKTATLPVSIRPDPGCQWRWLDTSELACRLPGKHHFAPATRYTVKVGTALKALDGSHLAEPEVQTFTTWRPKVSWNDFQAWRSPVTPVFMVRLNMPVSAAQLGAHIGFDDGQGDRKSVM